MSDSVLEPGLKKRDRVEWRRRAQVILEGGAFTREELIVVAQGCLDTRLWKLGRTQKLTLDDAKAVMDARRGTRRQLFLPSTLYAGALVESEQYWAWFTEWAKSVVFSGREISD